MSLDCTPLRDVSRDVPPDVVAAIEAAFQIPDELALFHCLDSWPEFICVVGDGANGAYEFVVLSNVSGRMELVERSDAEYGDDLAALRDALITISPDCAKRFMVSRMGVKS